MGVGELDRKAKVPEALKHLARNSIPGGLTQELPSSSACLGDFIREVPKTRPVHQSGRSKNLVKQDGLRKAGASTSDIRSALKEPGSRTPLEVRSSTRANVDAKILTKRLD